MMKVSGSDVVLMAKQSEQTSSLFVVPDLSIEHVNQAVKLQETYQILSIINTNLRIKEIG